MTITNAVTLYQGVLNREASRRPGANGWLVIAKRDPTSQPTELLADATAKAAASTVAEGSAINDPDLVRIGLKMGISPERISETTGMSLSRITALEAADEIEIAETLMAYGLAETSNGTGSSVGVACSVPVPCATRAARPTNTKAAAGRAVAAVPSPSLEDLKEFEAELLGMAAAPSSKQTGDNAIRRRFAAWRTPPEMEEIRRRFEAGQLEGRAARFIRWHVQGFSPEEISRLLDIPASEIRRVLRESCCGRDPHQIATASQPNLLSGR